MSINTSINKKHKPRQHNEELDNIVVLGRKIENIDLYTHSRFKRLFYSYKISDNKKGVKSWNDSLDSFINKFISQPFCVYCDSLFNLGLDRIDNGLGHTDENTVVSCRSCNIIRGDRLSYEEMKELGKRLSEIDESSAFDVCIFGDAANYCDTVNLTVNRKLIKRELKRNLNGELPFDFISLRSIRTYFRAALRETKDIPKEKLREMAKIYIDLAPEADNELLETIRKDNQEMWEEYDKMQAVINKPKNQ